MPTDLQTSAQPLWFIDNLAYVHVDGEESGEAYSLVELSAARDSMPPLHVHHRDDETFYVLEGELRLMLGGREIVLAAGQAALAPRGIPHTYRTTRRPGSTRHSGGRVRDRDPRPSGDAPHQRLSEGRRVRAPAIGLL